MKIKQNGIKQNQLKSINKKNGLNENQTKWPQTKSDKINQNQSIKKRPQ